MDEIEHWCRQHCERLGLDPDEITERIIPGTKHSHETRLRDKRWREYLGDCRAAAEIESEPHLNFVKPGCYDIVLPRAQHSHAEVLRLTRLATLHHKVMGDKERLSISIEIAEFRAERLAEEAAGGGDATE